MKKNWKTNFFNVYFDENSTKENIRRVLDEKNRHIPKYLYKYADTRHADDLLEKNLFFLPEISGLNDPYEGNVIYDLELQVERFINYKLKKANKNQMRNYNDISPNNEIDKIKELVEEKRIFLNKTETETDYELILSYIQENNPQIFENIGKNDVKKFFERLTEIIIKDTKIVCLTESKYNNPLWAHYSNKHNGICIQYNSKNFSSNLKENCFPIFYNDSNFTDNMPIKDVKKLKERYNYKAFLKKSEDWKCEKEWRIIIPKKSSQKIKEYYEKDGKEYLKLKPEAVYLGKEYKNKGNVIEKCKNNNIKIYKMEQTNTQYKLKANPITNHN